MIEEDVEFVVSVVIGNDTTSGGDCDTNLTTAFCNASTLVPVGERDADDDAGVVGDVVGIAAGVAMYALSFLTFVGNAMVLHAIRTEKRLQTVGYVSSKLYI